MEEDHHHRRRNNWVHNNLFSIPAAYIVILILTYAIGYFSNSSSNPPSYQNTHLTVSKVPPTVPSPTKCPDTTGHNQFGSSCVDPIRPDQVRQKILDKVFNGTSPYHNFPPAYVAGLLQPSRVTGWGSYGAVFKNLITRVRPNTIIEVGTFLGASAIHMADLTRQLGLDTQILCVDDFRGWAGFSFDHAPMINGDVLLLHQFLQNVMHSNATDIIIPVPFSAGSALDKLCEWGVAADLIEVDAGHDFHSAWADINRAHKLLRKPGGVLFGHDYFLLYDNKGVRRAVDLFAQVHGFKVTVDGEHWIIDSS